MSPTLPPPPRVAAVVPLYNHAAYVAAALESLWTQTRPPDQVIVVDDGSTDASAAVVRAFAAAPERAGGPPLALHAQANAGAHAALNRAVALAAAAGCGWVAVLNSDDRFHPARLARLLAHAARHPGAALFCTGLRQIDDQGRPLPADAAPARWLAAAWAARGLDREPAPAPAPASGPDAPSSDPAGSGPAGSDPAGPDLPAWLGRANFAVTTSNFFVRTDWLQAHPFGPYRYAHDYALLVRAALGGHLVVLEEELLDYRVHAANTIATAPGRLTRELVRVNLDLARELAPRLAAEPALRAAYARYRRACWQNFSAFRADVYEAVSAGLLARADAADPDLGGYPELEEFPNRPLANAGADPAVLAERCALLRARLDRAREELRRAGAWRELAGRLDRSRWVALGRLAGWDPAGSENPAAVPAKATPGAWRRWRQAVRASRWLAWGERLGSAGARAARAAAAPDGEGSPTPGPDVAEN